MPATVKYRPLDVDTPVSVEITRNGNSNRESVSSVDDDEEEDVYVRDGFEDPNSTRPLMHPRSHRGRGKAAVRVQPGTPCVSLTRPCVIISIGIIILAGFGIGLKYVVEAFRERLKVIN